VKAVRGFESLSVRQIFCCERSQQIALHYRCLGNAEERFRRLTFAALIQRMANVRLAPKADIATLSACPYELRIRIIRQP
jgi:hypothetical protein